MEKVEASEQILFASALAFIGYLPNRLIPAPTSVAKMSDEKDLGALGEKHVNDGSPNLDPDDREMMATGQNILHRDLQGRHMQMIAM